MKTKNVLGFLEGKILIVLLGLLAGVLVAGWTAALQLRQTVAANADVVNVDSSALIEVEKLRNIATSQVSNSRAYFLLGSKVLFDKQNDEKDALSEGLAKFAKDSHLGDVQELIKNIEAQMKSESEIFEQAMKYRSDNTESKIVGQFYQSKASAILADINKNFDQIIKLKNADLEQSRARAREAGLDAQAQVPKLMTWFTAAVAGLSLCLALLVVRMLFVRRGFLRERERLYTEAKNAVLSRDDVITAVARDFQEPVESLRSIAADLRRNAPAAADAIEATAFEIENLANDIHDQKNADMGTLALRLDQLDVAALLEDIQTMMQPLAKKRDIKLQVDIANQSCLAYFDRERIMRVLYNLVGNAIKFSNRHGRVSVKVKTDAEFVNISVADNGAGIPETQKATIFDNYWQAQKTADQGAGVGLGVAKTIITAHGGTIKADNALGQGSVFTFTLPRRRPANAPVRKPGVKRVAPTRQAGSPPVESTL